MSHWPLAQLALSGLSMMLCSTHFRKGIATNLHPYPLQFTVQANKLRLRTIPASRGVQVRYVCSRETKDIT